MRIVHSQNLEEIKSDNSSNDKFSAGNDNSKLFPIIPDEKHTLEDRNFRSETDVLISPRLISIKVAAKYCGLSPGSFVKMVKIKKFPPSIELGRRQVWDTRALDKAIDELSGMGSSFDPIMEQINGIH